MFLQYHMSTPMRISLPRLHRLGASNALKYERQSAQIASRKSFHLLTTDKAQNRSADNSSCDNCINSLLNCGNNRKLLGVNTQQRPFLYPSGLQVANISSIFVSRCDIFVLGLGSKISKKKCF